MGEYYQSANAEVMTLLMIEHIQGVENIEEILKVPGVDSIMIGALDLSGSMNLLGQTGDPAVESAIQKVLAACRQANVSCGIIALDPEQANRRVDEGFTNIIVALDVLTLISGTKAVLGKMARSGR